MIIYSKRGLLIIVLLFSVGIVSTLISECLDLDLRTSAYCYGSGDGWLKGKEGLWGVLYRWGEIFGLVVSIGAVSLSAVQKIRGIPSKNAKPAALVVLTMIIGPGVIVNGILKNVWGRPRPADVIIFGGAQEYSSMLEPRGPGAGKSFPCGHCSIGFALVSTAAFFKNPLHSAVVGVGAASYGVLLGVARVKQGGHFVTDVVWSGVIVLCLITGLYYLVFNPPDAGN